MRIHCLFSRALSALSVLNNSRNADTNTECVKCVSVTPYKGNATQRTKVVLCQK